MTFEVVKAVRKATPALIGIWGPSGSGKTLSALRMARGMVGSEGKIVLADTENRRAEFYANEVGGWDHIDVQPPFRSEERRVGKEGVRRGRDRRRGTDKNKNNC